HLDGFSVHGDALRHAVTGQHEDHRFGEIHQVAALLEQTSFVGKEPVPYSDVGQAREKLTQHVAERIFAIGKETLPGRLDHHQPRYSGLREHALAAPGQPFLFPRGLPFSLEAQAVLGEGKAALAARRSFLIGKNEPVLFTAALDASAALDLVETADNV